MIVVDTNVMVYLLTQSARGPDASKLFDRDDEWAAPAILFSELRNVLVGFVRRGWLDLEDALARHADAIAILSSRIGAVDGDQAMMTALETGLTAYDAEFVILARELQTRLITTDREILKAAPDVAQPL